MFVLSGGYCDSGYRASINRRALWWVPSDSDACGCPTVTTDRPSGWIRPSDLSPTQLNYIWPLHNRLHWPSCDPVLSIDTPR